jgi:hypothetical protein
VTLKTWDGSISMLDNADPLGPVMIYGAATVILCPKMFVDLPARTKNLNYAQTLKPCLNSNSTVDAQDGRLDDRGRVSMPFDKPILGIARLDDPKDKYLMKWSRAKFNPVNFTGGPKVVPPPPSSWRPPTGSDPLRTLTPCSPPGRHCLPRADLEGGRPLELHRAGIAGGETVIK